MARYNNTDDLLLDAMILDLDKRLKTLESAPATPLRTKLLRVSPNTNFSSTTYVTVASSTVVFPKKFPGTLLRVRVDASGFMSGSGRVDFGVNVDGLNVDYNDYDVAPFFFNTVNTHDQWSYARNVPDNVGAGTLLAVGDVSVSLRVKVSANTLTVDVNDLLSLEVSEVEAL